MKLNEALGPRLSFSLEPILRIRTLAVILALLLVPSHDLLKKCKRKRL